MPIRTQRSTEKSRHLPVQAHCIVTGTSLQLESGLEYDLVLMLERQPEIVWLVPQPTRMSIDLPGRRGTVHTPDLLTVSDGGEVTIWNARAAERQDEKFLVQSAAAASACADVGWGYEVFSGHSRAKKYNLRWLAAYRRSMPWYPAARDRLIALCANSGTTTENVIDADEGSGHLVSAMWHYAWRGELDLDLERWVGGRTVISWVGEPSDG